MEQNPLIFQKDKPGLVPDVPEAHTEAVEFVEKNRDLLEQYARRRIKIEPAPPGLDTFAFDLERDTIYINSRFYKKLGLSEPRTYFATCHEIEHFLEKLAMLAEPGGSQRFGSYLDRVKSDKAFGLMDNCVADIRENGTVVARNSKEFAELESGLYAEDLFPGADLTASPRHIQFCEALLNESRVPDRQMKVAPEVRAKLDEIRAIKNDSGVSLIDAMTKPGVPMSLRLSLQDHYIWPIVKELREKDIEDKKGGKQSKDNRGGTGQKPSGKKDKDKKNKSDQIDQGKVSPNDLFADDYAEAERHVPNAVPLEQIEKAFKKWQANQGESPLDRADREYADSIGVTKEQLQQHRQIVASLERIKNTETGETVIDELRQLFNRIIARRLKPAAAPRYPVEEGEELVDPAEVIAQAKAGNLEPRAWETHEIKEKAGKRFGEVEITLVFDRSGSMAQGSGAKMIEQRRAAVLATEALKEFGDLADSERVNLEKPLEVRSEIYTFQATDADAKAVKKMSKELSEKERIETTAILSSAPGNQTTDYVSLEAIEGSLTQANIQKISDGELKKIVIVFTDGESHGVQRVKNALEKLRSKGVIAVGVGITEDGKAALETYAPDARLAETAEKLTFVLGDLLKEHLTDV